jgi:hypothetical protein
MTSDFTPDPLKLYPLELSDIPADLYFVKFKYLGMKLTNRNSVYREIKGVY